MKMNNNEEIVISGAIANIMYNTDIDILSFLKEKMPELQIFKLVPTPGFITAAAFDWKIIGRIGSVVSIASFLWMAYIEFIKPLKKTDSDTGIIINIGNIDNSNTFWIGNQINSKEELLDSIEFLIRKNKIDYKKTIYELDSIRSSNNWVEVK